MHVKSKQVSLTIGQTKKVADIVVSISIPFKGIASCCLKKLKCSCVDVPELVKGSHEASIAYALFEAVRDKLSGSGLELFKTKASNVSCASINDNLVITFQTQGTGTALRKCVGLALSVFNPTKLFTKYSENIKFLSGKGGNKQEFNYVAKKLAEGIKKSIQITSVGKININIIKIKTIVDVVTGKLPSIDMPSAKETDVPSYPKSESSDVKQYPIIKCSGLAAAVVADYVRNNSNGMSVGIVDSGVIVYNHSWESKHKQLKDKKRIEDYIYKKYEKLEDRDELSAIFAYFSLSQGFLDSDIAAKLISTKLKLERLIELLKKSL